MNTPEQYNPGHITALEAVRDLALNEENGEMLRDAILHTATQIQQLEPEKHFEVISELAQYARQLRTWTEYQEDYAYNSSVGVEYEVLKQGFLLPGVTKSRNHTLSLHFRCIAALDMHRLGLPTSARKLGGHFYEVACTIASQQRTHAREIMRLTTTIGPLASYDSYFRHEAEIVLSRTVDVRVNPKYL